MNIPDCTADCWIEVSREALSHNLSAVRSLIKPTTRLMAVVKANTYGHGPQAACFMAENGADMLAVTHIREALAIREYGCVSDILVFSPLLPDQVETALHANLTATAGSIETLEKIAARLQSMGGRLPVHLKIDTGMGRLGVLPEQAGAFAARSFQLPGIDVRGVYTHFPTAMNADLRDATARWQVFRTILWDLETRGCRPVLAHCANSAALLQIPDTRGLEMIRPGTLLYGQFPAPFLASHLSLQLTWRMKSRVVQIKDVPPIWPIGYGSEYHSRRYSRIGVIPVGYADGLAVEVAARTRTSMNSRLRSAIKAFRNPTVPTIRVRRQIAPIIGRISMQLTTIDLTHLPDVQVGDTVEISCRRVTSNPLLPRILVDRFEDE